MGSLRAHFLHKGDHVHVGHGIASERLTEPAISIEQLLVQQKLDKNIPILTTKEASEKLKRIGFTHAYGLSKWDAVEVEKGEARLRLTAVPGRHGKRGCRRCCPR